MALEPLRHLVVFGESNVRGGAWLNSDDERWADILWHLLEHAQEAPLEYSNAGLGASVISPRSPGYEASTKPSASERLESDVIARNPDLVVIAYGLNDMRSAMAPVAFADDVAQIVDRLQEALLVRIVLANVYYLREFDFYPPFNRGSLATTRQYNELLRELAASRSCAYADVWSAYGQCDYVINPDTVHANKIGNLLVAHKVFEAIVHFAPGIAQHVQQRDKVSPWAQRAADICRKHVEESA